MLGTRPEAIKLAPVIKEFDRRGIPYRICVTGQHKDLLDPFLGFFEITPDYDLEIMKTNQGLSQIVEKTLSGLRPVLLETRPCITLVQGDTTSSFSAALAAFNERIPVAHIEAGLRSGNKSNPFPEEANRQLTDQLATWHFAPTERARENLINEGFEPDEIHVTGNTVVDALQTIRSCDHCRAIEPAVRPQTGRRLLLVTAHRRESFGEKLNSICAAIREIISNEPSIEIAIPVHPNPNVKSSIHRNLGDVDRIHLLEPLSYLPFVKLMEQAHLILTDSGGIQEEAPTLRKPVLVMRKETERPEVIECGAGKLVGTSTDRIVKETLNLLNNPAEYERMTQVENPYGSGDAAARITDVLARKLGVLAPERA